MVAYIIGALVVAYALLAAGWSGKIPGPSEGRTLEELEEAPYRDYDTFTSEERERLHVSVKEALGKSIEKEERN